MIRWILTSLLLSATIANAQIVIGEYGSMTGAQATFGISTDDGIQLAVKQRNAAGGINGQQIKLIAYDDQGNQQQVTAAVTRLIQEDHVVAVLGEVASTLSLAGGRICQDLGVPMISPSSTNAKVTAIGDMISRVCFIDSFQGYVAASFAKDKLGFTSAAILYDRSQAYSSGLRNDFKKAFIKMGGSIVDEEAYAGGDSDYSAQLTSIKNANPQFIYLPGYYTDVVNIALQARKLGITQPFIGGDGWTSDKLADAGSALDGCYFSDHYSQQDDRPEVKKFLSDFKAAYGQDPDSMAALGYDAANLLFDAIGRAKSLSGADLAAAINSTQNFPGVTGSITIDAHRNARKGAVIQVIHGGHYSFFARVEPPG
ncbi:MAG TPA: ABC transporter substrate-binding protein [Tepidisphaeraceae bacterium]|nr:ABC transporter substrate-binding protein [Tepidisphaeraceae bacterium]